MRTALIALMASGCAARSYQPTDRHIARSDTTIVDLERVKVLVGASGNGELEVDVKVTGDTVVDAVRLAKESDPPCGGGSLAKSVIAGGHPVSAIAIPIEGQQRLEVSFAPKDLGARLHEPAMVDVEAQDGCVRVELVHDDGTIEWIEAPDWAIGAHLDGFSTQSGPMRWGVIGGIRVERNLRWLVIGGALRVGRADGRAPWDHVDVLGASPSIGLRLADRGRWMLTATADYDLLLPAGTSADDKQWLDIVHGPRLTLRAGYGGEPVPWHAFRTRHAASSFGVELTAARWSGAGWVIGGGLAFAVGR